MGRACLWMKPTQRKRTRKWKRERQPWWWMGETLDPTIPEEHFCFPWNSLGHEPVTVFFSFHSGFCYLALKPLWLTHLAHGSGPGWASFFRCLVFIPGCQEKLGQKPAEAPTSQKWGWGAHGTSQVTPPWHNEENPELGIRQIIVKSPSIHLQAVKPGLVI